MKWNSISEIVPTHKKEVLSTDGKYCCVSKILISKEQVYIQFGFKNKMKKPTHWMELPKLPS